MCPEEPCVGRDGERAVAELGAVGKDLDEEGADEDDVAPVAFGVVVLEDGRDLQDDRMTDVGLFVIT